MSYVAPIVHAARRHPRFQARPWATLRTRLLSIAASAFAFFCVLLAWSGTAAAQTYPIQQATLPNTWQRPISCPANNQTGPLAFTTLKLQVPYTPGFNTITITATRTSGTGISLDVYQGGFVPGGECVNYFGGATSASNSVSMPFLVGGLAGFTNYFEIRISGNGVPDAGAFTLSLTSTDPIAVDCSTSSFSPNSQSAVAAAGGALSTVFRPGPGCTGNWTASSPNAWITGITPSGSGQATINYTVGANAGGARNASIAVAFAAAPVGVATFYVSQLAAGVVCTYGINPTSSNAGSAGGAGSFAVTANNGACGWTAVSNDPWITVNTASGTGNGTVNFTVAANSGAARSGTITAAGKTYTINQSNGCVVSINPTSASRPATQTTASFNVTAGSGCGWTVSEASAWLSGVTASGTGNGTVSYTAAANADAARSAAINVTNTSTGTSTAFTVNQASGCDIALTPGSASPTNAGGASSFAVATGAGCAWTTSESSPWISGVSAGQTNSGSVNYSVDANPGTARSANITVTATATNASKTFSVNQGDGCTASIAPASTNKTAAAGSGSFAITMSAPSCPWTATSNAGFLTGVTASGTGSGTINFNYGANLGTARSGTISVHGQTFTVNQDDGCAAALSPTSASPGAAAGNASFLITMSAPTCPWTASSGTPWLTGITASGTGTSTVNYSTQANSGPTRSGTITAGGKTFSVDQQSGCSVSLPITNGNVASAGGDSSFLVSTAAGCGYTVSSSEPWLAPTVTATGVDYSASASLNASRSATITVTSTTTASSATFTVNQAPGCLLALDPSGATATLGGGAASFGVTSGAGCTWTATSADPWLQGVTVTGAGVNYNVDVSTVPTRTGIIVLTNPETGTTTDFAVVQDSGCAVTLPVATGSTTSAGGDSTFAYTAGNGCVVTATSPDSWLTNQAVNGGNVSYSATANLGIARTGTVVVTTADTGSTAVFTVTQDDGCTVTLPVASGTIPINGGEASFLVTTGPGCTYTSTSPDTWLTAIAPTATGVTFTVDAALALARSGSIVVTNVTSASTVTYVINQDGPVVMPVITQQPQDVTVDEGQSMTFTVTATGGSLAYQWRKDGENILGANAATFGIAAAALTDDASYDVVVSNPAGSVTSNVALGIVRARTPDGGAPDGGGTRDGGGGIGNQPDGGVGSGDGGPDDGFGITPGGGGCNCDTAGTGGGNLAWFAVGLGVAFASLRRRRRSP